MSLSEIVNVSITKDTKGVSRKSFGTPLILGENLNTGSRIAYFTNLSSVSDAVGGTEKAEYKAAQAIFAQNPRVEKLAIGKRDSAESVDIALNAIQAVSDSWYGVMMTSRLLADQDKLVEWIDSQKKVCVIATSESANIDKSLKAEGENLESIAAKLKAKASERVVVVYHSMANSTNDSDVKTEYADAAVLGRILPLDPGSYTLKFKTLIGITVDDLNATESLNARSKNCNVYEEIGGRNIMREGNTPSGEFIDTTIFVDWLEARIQESVYGKLANLDKIPFTQEGILIIENALETPLKVGQNRGGISPKAFDENKVQIGGYYIETPELAAIPTPDKQNRVLSDVGFTAFLAGAIHKVKINGIVTL